jgi:hypothetical protein
MLLLDLQRREPAAAKAAEPLRPRRAIGPAGARRGAGPPVGARRNVENSLLGSRRQAAAPAMAPGAVGFSNGINSI